MLLLKSRGFRYVLSRPILFYWLAACRLENVEREGVAHPTAQQQAVQYFVVCCLLSWSAHVTMADRRRNKIRKAGTRPPPSTNTRSTRTRSKKARSEPPSKKKKKVQFQDGAASHSATDPMRKLHHAHPRHVIKLILKKLCEKPAFYRMLGTLGVALKSGGVNLVDFFLSNSNKLPKSLRHQLRYDINDQRMLILARMAVHKMLIREGTKLKSCILEPNNYPLKRMTLTMTIQRFRICPNRMAHWRERSNWYRIKSLWIRWNVKIQRVCKLAPFPSVLCFIFFERAQFGEYVPPRNILSVIT